MIRRRLVAALLALPLLAPMTASAEPLQLYCKLKSKPGDWVMPDIYVLRGPKSGDPVLVLDGLIAETNNKKPLVARIEKETADRLVISWRVDGLSTTKKNIKVQSSADLNKKSGAVQISANLIEYNQRSFARGTCGPAK